MRWQSLSEGIAQVRREFAAREQRDVTAEEIAEAVGVTPAAFSRWLKGERTPNEESVQALAQFFGVTPAYLRYGEEVAAGVLDRIVPRKRRPASDQEAEKKQKKKRST